MHLKIKCNGHSILVIILDQKSGSSESFFSLQPSFLCVALSLK